MYASKLEDRVIYRDGPQTRSLRGVITAEDGEFVTVSRRDGEYKIRKSLVEQIIRSAFMKCDGCGGGGVVGYATCPDCGGDGFVRRAR